MLRTKSADGTSNPRKLTSLSSHPRQHLQSSSMLRRLRGKQNQQDPRTQRDSTTLLDLFCSPSRVVFESVQAKKIYQMQLSIRNLSAYTAKFRIQPPATKNFRVSYDQSLTCIASGLAIKASVYFKTSQPGQDYFDELLIQVGDRKRSIPLSAYASKTQLKFQPTINLSHIRINEIKEFSIDFTNTGVPGMVQLRRDPTNSFTLSPENFEIGENQTKSVKVVVQPRDVGLRRHTIEVVVNNRTIEETIDTIYSVFEQSQHLLDDSGAKCKVIQFGRMYYGQKKSMKCKLFNNTPRTEELNVKVVLGNLVESGENFIRHQTPEEIGNQETSKIISVFPNKAVLKPFQQIQLTIVWHPEIREQHTAKVTHHARCTIRQPQSHSSNLRLTNLVNKFRLQQQLFQYTLFLSFSSTCSSPLFCTVSGFCLLPAIKFSSWEFDFGQITMGETQSKVLFIANSSKDLPVEVVVKKTSGIEVSPNKKVLGCGQEGMFEVRVAPVVLGVFCKDVEVLLEGLYTASFRVRAEVIAAANGKLGTSVEFQKGIQQTLELHHQSKNKTNYNRVLISHRQNRTQQNWMKKQRLFTSACSKQYEKIKAKDDDNLPTDLLFTCKVNPVCQQQVIKLPSQKEGLFVIRPVEKYQPYKKATVNRKRIKDEDYIAVSRTQPKSYKQSQQLKMSLTGQMLKSIKTNNSVINFGKLFINSVAKQPFTISNDLMTSIQVRLQTDHPCLDLIDKSKYIIGSSQRGHFDIILKTLNLGQLKLPVKYFINEVHQFELLVFAEVELVNLTMSKNSVKLAFTQDNNLMFTSETIILKNAGNSAANFSIQNTKKCTFFPNRGTVKEKSQEALSIRFKPPQTGIITSGQPKNLKEFIRSPTNITDQRVSIVVKDGVDLSIRIQASIVQPKCYIKQFELVFGRVIVYKQKIKTFTIKNVSRISAVFQVETEHPGQLIKVEPVSGRIPADGTMQISVRFYAQREMDLKSKIIVNIRAGVSIHLPVYAKVIIPHIMIVQSSFNFGTVTAMSTAYLPLTIWNKCDLPVDLIMDMNSPIYEGLDLEQGPCTCQDQIQIDKKKSIHKQRLIPISIEPQTKKEFTLKFTPPFVKTYNFELPLFLYGHYKTKTLPRTLTCTATEAILVAEPSRITFDKKIIIDAQKSIPSIEIITIKNLHTQGIVWTFGQELKNSTAFSLKPSQGAIQPEKEVKVKVSFNPTQKGVFRLRLPICLYDDSKLDYVKFSDILLEGQGDQPRLLFDKQEIILPPVPLGVESKAVFKILNQGYQNMTIVHKLDGGIQSNLLNVNLQFPEGKKVGINKSQIPVIATFSSKKPISFTAKLQFSDKTGKIYSVPVSGTSDNCLLTVFPYFSSGWNVYSIQSTPQSITLYQGVQGTVVDRLVAFKLPPVDTFDFSRQFIKKWLRFTLNDQSIGNFPEALVQENGETIVKLINVLVGKKEAEKMLGGLVNAKGGVNIGMDRLEFYQGLLKVLKSYGCLLNHLRAYYLLDQNQYETIIESSNCSSKVKKAITYKYWYISYISWINLFYQIIAVLGMPARSKQQYQQTLQHSGLKTILMDKQITSNVYSSQQVAILRWAETIWQLYNDTSREFTHFYETFKDGLALIFIVYHYIPVKEKLFEGVYRSPTTRIEICCNMKKVMTLLNILGVNMFANDVDLTMAGEKEFVLLLHHLYTTLPHYYPKSNPVIFNCYLGDEQTKTIDISNPSNKSVSYWVRIEGSSDYISEEKEFIKIQPHRSYPFKVSFKSRTSQVTKAYLILTNKRQGTQTGAAMVFQLKCQILGRKSVKILDPVHSPLYQLTSFRVTVQNKFEQFDYADFQIYMLEERDSQKRSVLETLDFKNWSSKRDKQQQYFYCDVQRLKLKRLSSTVIDVSYLPLSMEPIKCYLIFYDPNVGEFQYEVTGIPEFPNASIQIRSQPVTIDMPQNLQISIPLQNSLMNKARILCDQKSNNSKHFDMIVRHPPNSLDTLSKFIIINNSDPSVKSCVSVADHINLNISKKSQMDESQAFNYNNKLKLEMQFGSNLNTKQAVIDLVLMNNMKTDVRRIQVHVNILPKPLKMMLEMVTPARTPLIQMVPIHNHSDRDWRCKVTLITDRPEFSIKMDKVNKEIICKKGTEFSLPLSFSPTWIGKVDAKLIVSNLTTNEIVQYDIVGIGQQPLSENHMYIKCKLKKLEYVYIPISNPYSSTHTFKVQTDLANCYGSPLIQLLGHKKCTYQLTVNPILSGTYTGAITFYDEQDRYFWYTLTIQTQQQPAESTLELITTLLRPVEVDIEIYNPAHEEGSYEISIVGNDLYGDNQMKIPPRSNGVYKLMFAPKTLYEGKGSISFINQKLGQKPYALVLQSKESPPIKIPQIKCEIGYNKTFELRLPNHYKPEIAPYSKVSSPRFVLEKTVRRQVDSVVLVGKYKPIFIGVDDECEIQLSHESFGTQKYFLSGVGQFPSSPTSVQVYAGLEQATLHSITFENPFSYSITIIISLRQQNCGQGGFTLQKDFVHKQTLLPGQLTRLGFVFKPKILSKYVGEMSLWLNDKTSWKFSLIGHVLLTKDISQVYSTVCRTELVKYIDILVQELQGINKPCDYTFAVEYPEQYEKLLKKYMDVKFSHTHIENPKEPLRFLLSFRPTKPIKTYVELMIKRNLGGVWKYKIYLEGLRPPSDQTITIDTKHAKTGIVAFNLPFTRQQHQQFRAYIQQSQHSSTFQVSPTSGVYPQCPKLTVSYTPCNSFKTNCFSTLVIETEDYFWSYELKGVVTAYKPPVIQSKIRRMHASPTDKIFSSNSTVTLMKSSFVRHSSDDNIAEKGYKSKY